MSDPQRLYALLNELYLILDDGDRRLLSRFDLTPPRFYALVHLGNKPGISLSQLSGLMLCDKSNATRIIRGMEADGLVYRRRHESDGRTLRLFLTEGGDQLRREAMRAHERYNYQRFSDSEFKKNDQLLQVLQLLKRGLQDQLSTGSNS